MTNKQPPSTIALDTDEYHARYVGHTLDGLQIFITAPFIPASIGEPGRVFVAVYLFNSTGTLIEARIDDLGSQPLEDQTQQKIDEHVSRLGGIIPGRIHMKPFEIQKFGTTFGLIPRPPEDDADSWWVEAHPGNHMAFHEPWDSGEYDT